MSVQGPQNERKYKAQAKNGDADVENGCSDTKGDGGGMNYKIRIHIYLLLCVKQTASGKLLYSMRSSPQYSVLTQRGGMGGGLEGDLRERESVYAYS